jgi:A/G-specific adenine glycosylase
MGDITAAGTSEDAHENRSDEQFLLDPQWSKMYGRQGLCDQTVRLFKSEIYRYYLNRGRQFSWREKISPYRVLVSEMMLQQTQTSRVAAKFDPFMRAFPGFAELASAPFSDVLRFWKGLGYNRRAKYLHDSARLVVDDYAGKLPGDPQILVRFPGIGKATAASICVFAFNVPLAFIETNIRTVFIHFFFADHSQVADRDVLPLVEKTLDTDNPRQWFYALMDFGVMLKKQVGNVGRKSRHYQKQSPFAGSDRQVRGQILQQLLDHQSVEITQLSGSLEQPVERLQPLIEALRLEGLVQERDGILSLV